MWQDLLKSAIGPEPVALAWLGAGRSFVRLVPLCEPSDRCCSRVRSALLAFRLSGERRGCRSILRLIDTGIIAHLRPSCAVLWGHSRRFARNRSSRATIEGSCVGVAGMRHWGHEQQGQGEAGGARGGSFAG